MYPHRETNPHFVRTSQQHQSPDHIPQELHQPISQWTQPQQEDHHPHPHVPKVSRQKRHGRHAHKPVAGMQHEDQNVQPLQRRVRHEDQRSHPLDSIIVPRPRHQDQRRENHMSPQRSPVLVPHQRHEDYKSPPPVGPGPMPYPRPDDQHVQSHSKLPLMPSHPKHQGQHSTHQGRSSPNGLRVPAPRKTNSLTWFAAIFCAVFWVIIIIGGIIVLIVYLIFRPRSPRFEVSSVTLNAAYLDMGYLLNADVTVLVNFTNPNKKVSVDYNYMTIDLYYGHTLIASQYIQPFSAAKRESKFAYVHMVTSQVMLQLLERQRFERQLETNGVLFDVKGNFRARSNLGSLLRYSYSMHTQCTIMVTRPPDGSLTARKCKTKQQSF